MSTGYGWEGIRQVCAMLLGARHVPERLCGGACLQRGAITSVRPLLVGNPDQHGASWVHCWLSWSFAVPGTHAALGGHAFTSDLRAW